MIAVRSDLATSRDLGEGFEARTIDDVAELSLSLPDDLMDDLRKLSDGRVRSFATAAIREAVNRRKEADRQHLRGLVRELEEQVGPVDEAQVARFAALLAEAKAAQAPEDEDREDDYDDEDDE